MPIEVLADAPVVGQGPKLRSAGVVDRDELVLQRVEHGGNLDEDAFGALPQPSHRLKQLGRHERDGRDGGHDGISNVPW
jgi:hypothetical protein